MDIDGQETERVDIRLAPNPAATIEQEALDVAGVTLEQGIKCIWWGITTLDSITASYGLYSSNVGISISDHGSILTVWMYMLW